MFNLMDKKWWFFLFSGLVIIPGAFSLVRYGLRLSIDFTGGSLMELAVPESVSGGKEKLKALFEREIAAGVSVAETGGKTYLVRSKPIDNETHKKILTDARSEFGKVEERRFESVGPTVSNELTRKAFYSVLAACLAIIAYISYAFRKVPRPYSSWKFGVSAVVALFHDVLVVAGTFSILGRWGVEVDALFVTALLTIIGFSVHDTIVVFDRIRENLSKMAGATFEEVVNESIIQTFVRSLNTSVTVLLTLLAILLFGGETIRWFVLALFVGIASGTYSSIFNAAPILVIWEQSADHK